MLWFTEGHLKVSGDRWSLSSGTAAFVGRAAHSVSADFVPPMRVNASFLGLVAAE